MPDYANPQSLNRYAYGLNNPLRYTDPTGHWVLETNRPEKEQRRNAYIHAAERIKKKDAFSAHEKEYYLAAAAYYHAEASEDHAENIQIQLDHFIDKRDNLRRNGWNGVTDAKSAAGDVALGNAPDILGQTTIGAAGLVWSFGKHKSVSKWDSQMLQRGWTIDQINEALHEGVSYPAKNAVHPENSASLYYHPSTGRALVIDNVTNEVLHLGGDNYDYSDWLLK